MISICKKLCLFAFIVAGIEVANAAATPDIRLYVLNCGTIDVADGDYFSDTGFYKHKPLALIDPCYLIKHDDDWMLWDLGLGDKYLGNPAQNKDYGVTLKVSTSLISQLKQLKLNPKDIKYVGISHAHFDHTGNLNLFPHSTIIMQKKEYASIQEQPLPPATDPNLFKLSSKMSKKIITGNYDIFGDGSVVALNTPGHTPGHQSLEIRLPNYGVVILSNDLYHTRDAYKHQLIPVTNDNRADTLASMDKITRILEDTNGHLFVQHDKDDFESLPKFPLYLN